MCLNDQGVPYKVRALRGPTGFPDYEKKLKAGVSTWRYRPFLVDGNPVKVCTSVTFIFEP